MAETTRHINTSAALKHISVTSNETNRCKLFHLQYKLRLYEEAVCTNMHCLFIHSFIVI